MRKKEKRRGKKERTSPVLIFQQSLSLFSLSLSLSLSLSPPPVLFSLIPFLHLILSLILILPIYIFVIIIIIVIILIIGIIIVKARALWLDGRRAVRMAQQLDDPRGAAGDHQTKLEPHCKFWFKDSKNAGEENDARLGTSANSVASARSIFLILIVFLIIFLQRLSVLQEEGALAGMTGTVQSLAELDSMGVRSAHKYLELMSAMRDVGFSETEITAVHVVLLAVLAVGNIDFVVEEGSTDLLATVCDMGPIRHAAALLGIARCARKHNPTPLTTW